MVGEPGGSGSRAKDLRDQFGKVRERVRPAGEGWDGEPFESPGGVTQGNGIFFSPSRITPKAFGVFPEALYFHDEFDIDMRSEI